MIYTELTKKALRISFDAHREQVDKSDAPYVFHPFHLAEQMGDEYSVCVALLHDVIEDTDMTADDLTAAGFPKEVTDAVAMLTRDDSTPYLDYVRNIRDKNPLAAKVKAADLRHNSDLSRLNREPTQKDLERVKKYKAALKLLGEV